MAKLDLDALLQIKEKMSNPHNWDNSGICDSYFDIAGGSSQDLYSHFAEWPEFSGYPLFPVPPQNPDAIYESAAEAFLLTGAAQKWDENLSEYARARWRLLDFLIDKARAEQ